MLPLHKTERKKCNKRKKIVHHVCLPISNWPNWIYPFILGGKVLAQKNAGSGQYCFLWGWTGYPAYSVCWPNQYPDICLADKILKNIDKYNRPFFLNVKFYICNFPVAELVFSSCGGQVLLLHDCVWQKNIHNILLWTSDCSNSQ